TAAGPDGTTRMDELAVNKWLAPECIKNRIYSFASDSWAYGVTLYEIYSGGAMPYPQLDAMQAAMRVSGEGLTPEIPVGPHIAPIIQETMHYCFMLNPADRPPLPAIVGQLTGA